MRFELDMNISAKDIYQFALSIEEWGANFYSQVANKIKNKEISDFFHFLSEQEVEHKLYFQRRMTESSKIMTQDINNDHLSALMFYINSKMLKKEMLAQKLKNIKDMESTFEFAMGIELDSVMFYEEIKNSVPINDQGFIDDIIEQERMHFIRLLKLKRSKGL